MSMNIMLSLLALIRRLEFLGQIFDQNLQMTDELPNIFRMVLAFDKLNTLLDWRKAVSERYNWVDLRFG